ncbi:MULTISPECIES: VOC family protein [Pseudoxanthomonas]|uniref:Catechol 2,3-dioxygenase-like lactoylglutathione lyase family enzyme n=1 Tax=Pseudoxanthomonas winnipegensis TaxID=2480810 RepID=A0AAW8GFT0_9GAMM|nr:MULTISPECIES: VOC family protein [Pseudoxanthomonas]MDQ1120473.1 catechol 2,3-dioxygenase-like lactoylglutathione lyase family enzyme [Pseudoxanthomonas winnipegensis]MDQ1133692.1 catechol 2,3-dioxygenase-like lactoylglutathione lyase family enzyme [Pseudoxanthomonas winnipegensis]MDR6140067.1 catechol 2,3-dioxygenase-like lactoylglutathione lyase family enzyme [Pseudoxanthomonas sp. SORGH_AS_0997]
MHIIGPDYLIFGVDDLAACSEYLLAFGLNPVDVTDKGGLFEALDGTGVIIRHHADPSLPPPLPSSSMLRQQVYGVRDGEVLDAIEAELSKDRRVTRLADGAIEAKDDQGFELKFQVTRRRALVMPAERINAPGAPVQRGPNELGVWEQMPAAPRTLSHVVLFVPDIEVAANFYCSRLGFVVTDVLSGAGPFLQPRGNDDHHTLFFIRTPEYMKGCEHLAFHMGGPTELMVAGTRFVKKGYQSFWGPGRHKFGSNWFWYFNSPFGCHFEYDADMDKHDGEWLARETPMNAESSQIVLFEMREKWAPGGPPPGAEP